MNKITKKEAEEIIEKLALGNDCGPNTPWIDRFEPVYIGDILEVIAEKRSLSVAKFYLHWWQPLGFNKSLQQILEENITEECNYSRSEHFVLRPLAMELFLLLKEIV